MSVPDKHFSVVVAPQGWTFDASDAVPLLDAAKLSDVRLPSSCKNGTCRTCMCRLISGQVKYNIEWPGLSREEKLEGYILPCVAHPLSDVVIDMPTATRIK